MFLFPEKKKKNWTHGKEKRQFSLRHHNNSHALCSARGVIQQVSADWLRNLRHYLNRNVSVLTNRLETMKANHYLRTLHTAKDILHWRSSISSSFSLHNTGESHSGLNTCPTQLPCVKSQWYPWEEGIWGWTFQTIHYLDAFKKSPVSLRIILSF